MQKYGHFCYNVNIKKKKEGIMMSEFFANVSKVKYEGPSSTNPFAFKYYDAEKVIAGKTMKEHLRFALSWWHTLTAGGNDPFGAATIDRTYGGLTDEMEIAKAKVDAGFELMSKLGIDFFCFHDADIAPEGNTFEESKKNLMEIVDYIKAKMDLPLHHLHQIPKLHN